MSKLYYTFKASNGTSVTCYRGEMAPKMTAGGGGWEVVPRPRRIALTIWRGRDPYKMTVPFMIDGYRVGRSIESDIARLNQMQMGANLRQPPTVTINGAVPVKGATWVIESIEWGDDVYWAQEGSSEPYRMRQNGVINFVQYVEEERVTISRDVRTRPRTYTTKRGDTLRKIAAKPNIFNDSDKWRLIAQAQKPPLRVQGTTVLKEGKVLRIP